ncbi:MAG: type IVB secretion system protein IcmH/DotU [Sulfuricurvum sp.]|uniref:type IVB secretion system protein IcmH/DotU n=1 Tax=Sulfuricurvum sp. TaxID=2025608 RepID=UPI002602BF99|nr:type IVB secretion system protein IcmH/DotU [Sulfuricurvum sp.]MDD5158802.1 type IVB secretion system protein IcmH/DotU [Sulfuricurvum sp.]
MSDNKTVLLPSSEAQETLTGFSSSNRDISGIAKVKPTIAQQQYKAFFQEHEPSMIEGMNPFISLAKPIFVHIDKLLHTYDLGDVGNVHALLIEEIDAFTQNAAKQNVENSQVLVARYLLCTFLDELICTTHWGKNNDWARDSLLGHFYRETYGGEKFFQLLTKLLASPANNIHLLEFMYVCISLGFEGKYRIQTRGKMELDAIRDNLYKQIKTVQGRQAQTFYAESRVSSQKHHYVYKAPYLVLIIGVIAIVTIVYVSLSLSLNAQEKVLFPYMEHGFTKDFNVKN